LLIYPLSLHDALPISLCSDHGYMEMRLRRLDLIPSLPGTTSTPADQLKDYCAHPGGYTEIPDRDPVITELIRKTIREAAQGKVRDRKSTRLNSSHVSI